MTPNESFERTFVAWLDDEDPRRAPPALLTVVLSSTATRQPLPAWRARDGIGIAVGTRSRPARSVTLALVAILVLIIVTTLALAFSGSRHDFNLIVAPSRGPGPSGLVAAPSPQSSAKPRAAESAVTSVNPTASLAPTRGLPSTTPVPSAPPSAPRSALPSPSEVSRPAYQLGKLAYMPNDPIGTLYVADTYGANPTIVSSNAYLPAWYGSRLSWQDEAKNSLMVRDAAGTIKSIFHGRMAGWQGSPDGRRFAVINPSHLTIIAANGSRTDLALPSGYQVWDTSDLSSLSWMPDGSAVVVGACKAAATCQKGGFAVHGLFLVPLNGDAPVALNTPNTPAFHAQVSHDGTHIAFESCASLSDLCYSLGIMGIDGTDRTTVVAPQAGSWFSEWWYQWSADGKFLAFAYEDLNRDQGQGVWVVPADGSAPPRQVAPSAGSVVTEPSGNQLASGGYWIQGWSPDDSTVLVAGPHNVTGDALQSIPLDGSASRILVPNAYMGAWQWIPNP